MINELNDDECFALMATTTIGRLGFVEGGRVLVIPVNYLLDGRDVIVRTTPDGLLSGLPESTETVAFEIDHHDDLGGHGWSVLLNGPVSVVTAEELDAMPGTSRVQPWAGGDRPLTLRLRPDAVSGRRVSRERR